MFTTLLFRWVLEMLCNKEDKIVKMINKWIKKEMIHKEIILIKKNRIKFNKKEKVTNKKPKRNNQLNKIKKPNNN